MKQILIITLILCLFIVPTLSEAYIGYNIRPKVSGFSQADTAFNMTLNYTNTTACGTPLLSVFNTTTTDRYGVGFINFNIDSLTTPPRCIMEIRNGVFRKNHTINTGLFRNVLAWGNITSDSDICLTDGTCLSSAGGGSGNISGNGNNTEIAIFNGSTSISSTPNLKFASNILEVVGTIKNQLDDTGFYTGASDDGRFYLNSGNGRVSLQAITGDLAMFASAGAVTIQSLISTIHLQAAGGQNMLYDAGANFLWRDQDAADATRMTLASGTGALTTTNELFTQNLHNLGGVGGPAVQQVTSGTYIPVFVATANLGGAPPVLPPTVVDWKYLRNGNTVTVSGQVDFVPAGPGALTTFTITIPTAMGGGGFITIGDAAGTGARIDAALAGQDSGGINANAGAVTVTYNHWSTTGAPTIVTHSIIFQYEVI